MNATANATARTTATSGQSLVAKIAALALIAAVALVWGLVTARLQFVYAPWLLFPLGGGLILGGALVVVCRATRLPDTRWGAVGVSLLACAIAVPAEHVFCYRHDVAESLRHPAGKPETLAQAALPELKRDTFWQYMQSEARLGRQLPFGIVARGTAAWLSHGLDAALVVAGTLLVTLRFSVRRPSAPSESTTPFAR